MQKLLFIALKDVLLACRDRAALILMLAAPLALTLGLGVVTGRFSGTTAQGLSNIPVVIVNEDAGQLGQALMDVFSSPELGTLTKPMTMTDRAAARKRVADDAAAAALIIPAGFTESIIPNTLGDVTPVTSATIELNLNPAQPIGAGVIQSIVETFLSRVEVNRVSGQVALEQLVMQGRLQPSEVVTAAQAYGERQAHAATTAAQPITIEHISTRDAASSNTTSPSEATEPATFDPLAYLAPSMALLFLMFTVTRGGAQLLTERDGGTLARMLTTPTATAQVLGGKVVGIFLTALAQISVLIFASSLFFGLRWGSPIGLILLAPAVALAATGWGLLITSFVKTPQQAGSVGTALMLLFGVLGGSFGNQIQLPVLLQWAGRITPNAWGIQGFATLASGGAVADIVPNTLALLAIAGVTFFVAVFMFQRNGFARR